MENNKKLHSPCLDCFQRGIIYPSQKCENCEYSVCISIIKKILYAEENCSCCRNRKNLGGGYWDCLQNLQDTCSGKYYDIDWNLLLKEYKNEIGEK